MNIEQICPNCKEKLVFFDSIIRTDYGIFRLYFNCFNCGYEVEYKLSPYKKIVLNIGGD